MWTLLLAFLACDDQDEAVYSCQVTLEELAPNPVLPGETVVLKGKPMSTVTDSALWIGGASAEITDVTRADCEVCDACKTREGCVTCGEDCDACDSDCLSCEESLSFVVPELEPGEHSLQLFNLYGASESPLALTVDEASVETGDTAP